MTEYQRVGSFDRSSVTAVGVGDEMIAVASGREITLESGTDRLSFEHDAPVTDVALGDRVIVLSSNQLATYSRDGDRIWSRTFDDPHAVTTLQNEPLVGVLEADCLRAVALDTGQEAFTTERPRSGTPRDDRLIGVGDQFIVSTWSFLWCVDATGSEVFDRGLDTAVRDIGCCDETIVAGLQTGELHGFAVADGTQQWQTELPVRQIAPNGGGSLFVSTDDGTKSIDSNGVIDSAGQIASGRVYAGRDGSVVCSIRDGTVVSHVPNEGFVDINVLTDSVGVGGTIDVEVTTLDETFTDLTVQGDLNHADLSPSERQLSLSPREPTVTDFPVDTVRTDGDTEFTLSVDGREITRVPITITDAAESTVTAEAELNPIEISSDVVHIELSVDNTGSIPLDSVRVLETNDQTEDIAPGETWTETITKPYEPGRTITVGMEVSRGNRRTSLAPTCQLPDLPSITVEQRGNALHGQISADEDVAWSDELIIEVPGADRIRSDIDIEDGSLLVVIPVYEHGIARIGLSRVDVTERCRVTDSGPLSGSSGSSQDTSLYDRSSDTRGRSDSSGGRDRGHTGDSTESTMSHSETELSDEQRASGTVDSSTREPPAGGPDAGVDLSLERTLSDRSVSVGHAVEESFTVRNTGNSTATPTLVIGEFSIDLDDIDAGESSTIERTVTTLSAGKESLQLPSADVRIANEVIDSVDKTAVTVADDGLNIRGVVDPDDGSYRIEVENAGSQPRRIEGIDLHGQHVEDKRRPIPPGEHTTFIGTIQSTPDTDTQAIEGAVHTGDQSTDPIQTIVAVDHQSEVDQEDPFQKTIDSSTKVAGSYGTVVLVFKNESDTALSDVSLAADSETVNDMLYSRAHRETLAVGERIEHYVDLKANEGEVTFDITASYTAGDGPTQTRQFLVSGQAVAAEDDWTERHLSSWSLEPAGQDGVDGTLPDRLSTPYRRRV